MTETDLMDVIKLGVEMRDAQKEFFTKGRTPDQLKAAKNLERDFDRAAAGAIRGQDDLL